MINASGLLAINVDAEILLIDEILAVGDQHFQDKCFDKLKICIQLLRECGAFETFRIIRCGFFCGISGNNF